jgi:GNAT superfamily N-acetyltransferase
MSLEGPTCAYAASDVEAIERATIAAVSPDAIETLDGWLLPFDAGTIGRAKSAVPLRHQGFGNDDGLIDRIEARYKAHGLPAVFRLCDLPAFATLQAGLERRHYAADHPTRVQLGSARRMQQLAASDVPAADVDTAPDAAWASVFLGDGFDPVDGAHRVRVLGRAQGSLYASVREGGRTLAVGTMAFGHGWASVHGMRTGLAQRGRGLAGRVLAALGQAALVRGVERVFLQVEAGNPSALALYRRAGFETAWLYRYWR